MTEATRIEIEGYRVFEAIGSGALATVRRGERVRDNADVALKILRADISPSSPLAVPFAREARILRQLSHPNVIRFVEAGTSVGASGGDFGGRRPAEECTSRSSERRGAISRCACEEKGRSLRRPPSGCCVSFRLRWCTCMRAAWCIVT